MFVPAMPLLAVQDHVTGPTWWGRVLAYIGVEHPLGVLAVLLGVLGVIFWLSQQPWMQRFFRIIPVLVLCYFVPTTLTTFGILPEESALYSWIKTYVLPASLFLLILSLDLPGILRLGWKPVVMLLTGTTGVVIGGPVALFIGQQFLRGEGWALPEDGWTGLAALSGSWIGGGANFLAIGDVFGTTSDMLATMVVPDVLVASVWMGALLYMAAYQHKIDAWNRADASAIRALEQRLSEFQAKVARVPSLADLIIIFALGFGASWVSYKGSDIIGNDALRQVRQAAERAGVTEIKTSPDKLPVALDDETVNAVHIGRAIDKRLKAAPDALRDMSAFESLHYHWARFVNDMTGASMWKYVIVTTLGLVLSFTRVRNLEGAGASKIGSVMLYLLVATIGATANFAAVARAPGFVVVGFMWIAIHVILLLTVARLIRAPVFFMAVGSQANIGGAASAPIVASAYHPSLAPVGVLLAVAGYVLGTYAGVVCGTMLKWVAGMNGS